MRLTALVPLLLLATPLPAKAEADLDLVVPRASHDLAMTCLALWVTDLESNGADMDPRFFTAFAVEMAFFSRVIALRATPEEAASFDTLLARKLTFYRAVRAAQDNPATQEEADMELTGTGRMCYFDVLADEGGLYEGPGPYELPPVYQAP